MQPPQPARAGFWVAQRAALFAVLMLFIGPLVSQTLAMPDHHPAPGLVAHGAGHHSMPANAPPSPAPCDYCSLFVHCPALPHTLTFIGACAPPAPLVPTTALLRGHNSLALFPGALTRAPPSTLA